LLACCLLAGELLLQAGHSSLCVPQLLVQVGLLILRAAHHNTPQPAS
jgi:hypothetical protein